jgi:hypothetical protein
VSAGTISADLRRTSAFDSLARDKYIVSPAFDWTFFIGSPLLAVAVVHVATRFFSEGAIGGAILTYMALGHHVPTFLRAYADPDEFARNRFRLTAVPLLVVTVVAILAAFNSHLLALVFIWDQYHFVRQHYGFMRIYDAKNGSTTSAGPNLDLWLCFSLFVYIVAKGDFYSYVYSSELFAAGVAPPLWLGPLLLNLSFAIAVAVLVLFGIEVARRVREGEPVSMLKIAVTLTTYGVWYYAYVVFSNPFLSYGISSLFHCLQYDALAWHYNRRKASSLAPGGRGRFFRFVHGGRHLWAYVGAILAYGAFSSVVGGLAPLFVFIVNRTTGVLHYYYDSFIWQVRRAEFRKLLE